MNDQQHENPSEEAASLCGRVWFGVYFSSHSGIILGRCGYLQFRDGPCEGYFGSLPGGRSEFTYSAPWGSGASIYQGISFWIDQPTLIELHVTPKNAGVMINGVWLTDSAEQLQVPYSDTTCNSNAYTPYMSRRSTSTDSVRIRRFLQIVENLEQAALSGDEGRVVSATGSLRLLLIEGFVDEVNRDYRVKLRYKMPVEPALSIDAQYSHIPDIYNHPGSTAELSKSHFLRHTAAVINSAEVSVADIIRLAANSLGVHHFGASGGERTGQDLFRFYEGFSVRNAPGLVQLMTQILAIVLDALLPLIERIAPVPINGDRINA